MKCDDCKFADWYRTANGRLHPGKQGQCRRLDHHPLDLRLPKAFYWVFKEPTPGGGSVERGKELRENCAFKTVERKP